MILFMIMIYLQLGILDFIKKYWKEILHFQSGLETIMV